MEVEVLHATELRPSIIGIEKVFNTNIREHAVRQRLQVVIGCNNGSHIHYLAPGYGTIVGIVHAEDLVWHLR